MSERNEATSRADRYVVITNPGHSYAARFVEVIGRRPGLRAVALFTLRWRYEKYQRRFAELGAAFEHVVCAFDLGPEAVASALADALGADAVRVAAIIPWDDSSGIMAGHISERFGLPGSGVEMATRFKLKSVMRSHLDRYEAIPKVAWKVADSLDEALAFQARLDTWPVVLKPTNAGGSWKVVIARDLAELRGGFEEILGADNEFDGTTNTEVQLEEFIPGREYAVNGLTDRHGKVLITDVFRYAYTQVNDFENFIEEADYLQPETTLVAELSDAIRQIIEAAGLRNSPFHGELRMTPNGPRLIEVQARFAGHLGEFVDDAILPELFDMALSGYLGELEFAEPFAVHRPAPPVHAKYVSGASERSGVLEKIVGEDAVARLDCFVGFSLFPTVGDTITAMRDEDHMLYVILLAHAEQAKLAQDVRAVRDELEFVIT